MSFPGAVLLSTWVAPAPTGQEEAFVLLTAADAEGAERMPLIADGFGLPRRAGGWVTNPDVGAVIDGRGWIGVVAGGTQFTRPGNDVWRVTAERTGRAVLVVGLAAMPAGMGPDVYTDRHGGLCRIGLVPLRAGEGL